jgi:hypothetical protein
VALYHFSEEPDIRVFEPRVPPGRLSGTPVVWAIHHDRQMMYYTPRDCPRACFWPGELTTAADRALWFGNVSAPMVIAIESRWFERLRSATLYRYTLPEASFTPARGDDSGHWVSTEASEPAAVETLRDLPGMLIASGVELRITPSLISLWKGVIQSSLQFSGTRLRNAEGWSSVDWDAVPLGRYATPAER